MDVVRLTNFSHFNCMWLILFLLRSSTVTRYSVQYNGEEDNISKSRGSHLRVHFKHCREITHFCKGKKIDDAIAHLDKVLKFEAVIPFVRFTGGIGRKAMAKQVKAPGAKGRWPVKATAVVRDLLSNAKANAEAKDLDTDNLVVSHAQCNRAPAGRRRTYRAHGRIGKYASQPAHIEIVLAEKKAPVAKADDEDSTSNNRKNKKYVKVGGA